MSDSPFGHVFEYVTDAVAGLGGKWVSVPTAPTEVPFFTDAEDPQSTVVEFDAGVDAAAVERQIRTFHRWLLIKFKEAGLPGGPQQEYVVFGDDGRWHPDDVQAYMMKSGRPHLTPREWVLCTIAIHTQSR